MSQFLNRLNLFLIVPIFIFESSCSSDSPVTNTMIQKDTTTIEKYSGDIYTYKWSANNQGGYEKYDTVNAEVTVTHVNEKRAEPGDEITIVCYSLNPWGPSVYASFKSGNSDSTLYYWDFAPPSEVSVISATKYYDPKSISIEISSMSAYSGFHNSFTGLRE